MSIAVCVRLPERPPLNRARWQCHAIERSKSSVIQKALDVHLEEQAAPRIALDRLNDPTDAVVSFEDMRLRLTHTGD